MSDQVETYEQIADRFGWADAPTTSEVPDILYHYTDAAGLIGILSSGIVRATDFRYLNDASEVLHTDKIVRDIISKKFSAGVSPTLSRLYSHILSRDEFIQDDEQVYIFSMTEDADSLSQWRAYGQGGKGFAIGFDGRQLAEMANSSAAEFGIRRIIYEKSEQQPILVRALDALEEKYKRDVRGKKQTSSLIVEASSAVGDLVVYRGSTNKHSAFKDEKEWRLVSFPDDKTRPKVRSRGSELVPFLEVRLSVSDRLPISRVGIGPAFSGGSQGRAAKMLCEQFGYDPEIYFADAPYRAL